MQPGLQSLIHHEVDAIRKSISDHKRTQPLVKASHSLPADDGLSVGCDGRVLVVELHFDFETFDGVENQCDYCGGGDGGGEVDHLILSIMTSISSNDHLRTIQNLSFCFGEEMYVMAEGLRGCEKGVRVRIILICVVARAWLKRLNSSVTHAPA
jgi:hypothetical protein